MAFIFTKHKRYVSKSAQIGRQIIRNPKKSCEMCGLIFQPRNGRVMFCGSKTNKIGCSYKHGLIYQAKFRNNNTAYYKKYFKGYIWTQIT